MGSNLKRVVDEGYHVHEAHLFKHLRKSSVKPYLKMHENYISHNLPLSHAMPIVEYDEILMD